MSQKYKRIVFKVGSGVLTENNKIAKDRMLALVSLLAGLKSDYEIILVTSGAVSAGYTALQLDRSIKISKKVLAAVGQPILMSSYKNKFEIYGIDTAQILLTEDDFDSRERTEIFRQIINTTLKHGILPIVNENDISTTEEQLFGDNDQLSAHVTYYTNSDLLIILSDIDGYYDSNPSQNPDAKMLKIMREITDELLTQEEMPTHEFASGGIVTKLKAASYLMSKDKEMFLCSGYDLKSAKEFITKNIYNKGTLFTNKS
ncbi:MAG: glutamate 5-kinase [Sulfurimonas sp.]|nr:glutamate 5-kinase [Sulfurimonas sp.]